MLFSIDRKQIDVATYHKIRAIRGRSKPTNDKQTQAPKHARFGYFAHDFAHLERKLAEELVSEYEDDNGNQVKQTGRRKGWQVRLRSYESRLGSVKDFYADN